MYRKFTMLCALSCIVVVLSCRQSVRVTAEAGDSDTAVVDKVRLNVLVTDEELAREREAEHYNERADELFDDFLYNYIHDTLLQRRRTAFPVSESFPDGITREVTQSDWHNYFDFMDGEYVTTIYNSEAEKTINEDTTLLVASVEKIDLEQGLITSYDFARNHGEWAMEAIRNITVDDSDLADFIHFYSRFSRDAIFMNSSIARFIHVSMSDSDDDTQTMDGFISREQWSTIGSSVPDGIITNIRYGQRYHNAKRILMEKNSLGSGMSETFCFVKGSRGWELVGYEN